MVLLIRFKKSSLDRLIRLRVPTKCQRKNNSSVDLCQVWGSHPLWDWWSLLLTLMSLLSHSDFIVIFYFTASTKLTINKCKKLTHPSGHCTMMSVQPSLLKSPTTGLPIGWQGSECWPVIRPSRRSTRAIVSQPLTTRADWTHIYKNTLNTT